MLCVTSFRLHYVARRYFKGFQDFFPIIVQCLASAQNTRPSNFPSLRRCTTRTIPFYSTKKERKASNIKPFTLFSLFFFRFSAPKVKTFEKNSVFYYLTVRPTFPKTLDLSRFIPCYPTFSRHSPVIFSILKTSVPVQHHYILIRFYTHKYALALCLLVVLVTALSALHLIIITVYCCKFYNPL